MEKKLKQIQAAATVVLEETEYLHAQLTILIKSLAAIDQPAHCRNERSELVALGASDKREKRASSGR